MWIITKRQKTSNNVELPLLDVPQKIIIKYEPERNDLNLLPVMSNQKLNSYLKELADICGITKRLNFHTARHMKYSNKLYFSALQSQICR